MENIEKYLKILETEAIQVSESEVYDTHDVESIYEEIIPKFQQFDELLVESEEAKPENEPIEQSFGEEEEMEDNFDIANDDPDNVAMALEEEESSESEKPELSEYQEHREKLLKLIEETENSLIQKKDWQYQGEITASERPENALLDELPDFQVKRKLPLEINEEINEEIEELIKLKILDKKFENPLYAKETEQEKSEKISFEKNEKALGEVIAEMGEREELPQAVKELENKVSKEMQEVEAELRSYFVEYQIVK